MNGFISPLAVQLAPQPVLPAADGPRPPSCPAAAHACGLRFPRSTEGAPTPPHPRFRSPHGPAAPTPPSPPGSSTAAASTDAFGYAHMSSTRSRLFGGGKMLAKCVPRCLAMARLCSDAFPKGPRTRKTPVRGKICAPCIQNELVLARYACHVSKKPCKSSLEDTPRADLATKALFSRPRPSNHA